MGKEVVVDWGRNERKKNKGKSSMASKESSKSVVIVVNAFLKQEISTASIRIREKETEEFQNATNDDHRGKKNNT